MCYSELIHIQCGHARRFGSPSAGSEPRLYCTSARPFAAARHELETGAGRRRLHFGGIEGGRGGNCWVCWPDTFWLGRWLLTSQPPPGTSPPALSGSYESNLNAADRPHRGGPQAVVSESHPSGEPEWSTNLASVATSQLASSIQFQVFVCLSFTGKFKFVSVASRPESLRSRVFGTLFQVRCRLSTRLSFRVVSFIDVTISH